MTTNDSNAALTDGATIILTNNEEANVTASLASVRGWAMSDKEKKVYGLAIILIVSMCLFPPWEIIGGAGVHYDRGYSLLVSAPHSAATINYGRLGVQIFAVAVAAFGIAKLVK